jgi:hypothetical protein
MLSKMDEALRQAGYNIMILCMQLDEALGEQMIHTRHIPVGRRHFVFPLPQQPHPHRLHGQKQNALRPSGPLDSGHRRGLRALRRRAGRLPGGAAPIGLGHRRFLFLSGVLASSSQLDRHRGFLRALAEAGVSADSVRVVPWEAVSEGMMNEHMGPLLEPLELYGDPVFSDEIAYHALKHAPAAGPRRAGGRVPSSL